MSKGSVYIILSAVSWGLIPLFSRLLFSQGLNSIQVVAMRCFITCIFFGTWAGFRGLFKMMKLKDAPYFIMCGIVSIAGTYFFYSLAIEMLTMAMAAVLMCTAPAFVIIFSRLIYKEPITVKKLLALIFTFAGCCLVVRLYSPDAFKGDILGIVYGFLSGLCYAMLSVFGRKGLELYSAEFNTIFPTIFAGVLFFVVCPPWKIPIGSGMTWLLFIGLAILGSVLPYALYIRGMELGVEAGDASIIASLEPVVAALVGVYYFKDSIELLQVIGMAVMLLGTMIPALGASKIKLCMNKS